MGRGASAGSRSPLTFRFSKNKGSQANPQAYAGLDGTLPVLRKLMRALFADKGRAFEADDAKSVFKVTFPLARFQCCPPQGKSEHGWQETTLAVRETHKQILVNEANLPASFLAHAATQGMVTRPPTAPLRGFILEKNPLWSTRDGEEVREGGVREG